MLLYGGGGSPLGGASSLCPCDFCGNTTYCNKMEHTIVPIGLPKQGVNRLLLDHNNITELRSGSFKQMFSLTELVLNNNKINTVDPKSLSDLGNLLYLYLDYNEISVIHPGTLLGLVKLKRLFLDGNRLTTIPSDVPQLHRLERISLERNEIKVVDWTSFVRLKSLRLVKIWTGNPITCSCNTLELVRWLDDRPKLISGKYLDNSCTRSSVTCTQAEILSIRHYSGNTTKSVYDSGGRLHVHCDVTGVPMPMVVWRHPAEGFVYPYKSGRIESFRNGTLAINQLSYNDSGRYICYAIMGDMKKVANLKTTLRVSKFNPRVVVTPDNRNIYVALGKQASMACVVSSNRAVTLEWFTPDNLMVQVLTSEAVDGGGGKYRLLDDGKTLEISDVTDDDLGTYKCVASNQLGVAEAEIKLAISEGNLLLMILCGCGGALLVLLMIAGGCMITRMRQKSKIKSSSQVEGDNDQGLPPGVISHVPRQHDWVTSSASEDDVRVREELPQPFTIEPEVKGFRL